MSRLSMDVVLSGLVVRAALGWREGDETVVRTFRAVSPNPTLLPSNWIGDHEGVIVNNLDIEVGTVDVTVEDDDGALSVTITVNDPETIPRGNYSWDAKQTSGAGAGEHRFARATVTVEDMAS